MCFECASRSSVTDRPSDRLRRMGAVIFRWHHKIWIYFKVSPIRWLSLASLICMQRIFFFEHCFLFFRLLPNENDWLECIVFNLFLAFFRHFFFIFHFHLKHLFVACMPQACKMDKRKVKEENTLKEKNARIMWLIYDCFIKFKWHKHTHVRAK